MPLGVASFPTHNLHTTYTSQHHGSSTDPLFRYLLDETTLAKIINNLPLPAFCNRTISAVAVSPFPAAFHVECSRAGTQLMSFCRPACALPSSGRLACADCAHPPPQYDWDTATTAAFLQHYGLQGEFRLNLECNHATLAGHSCEHELQVAALRGLLGGIDANSGDPQVVRLWGGGCGGAAGAFRLM
jgi:hypothetical protein